MPLTGRRKFLAGLTGIGLGGVLCRGGLDGQTQPIAFAGVTVIEGTERPPMSGMTVVISGDRIRTLGLAGKTSAPKGARLIDARDKFLLPGLWDMHVHGDVRDLYPVFIAHGVTGVRIMSGLPHHRQWRKEIAGGKLIGPRLVVASPILNGPNNYWGKPDGTWSLVENPEQGRAAVRNAIRLGSDFIKVYESLNRDSYFAIADEAKKRRIPFVGHVPELIWAAEASAVGQKSIEHLTGILMSCSTAGAAWMKERIAAKTPAEAPRAPNFPTTINTFSESLAADLFAVFRKNRTWQCPTMTVLQSSLGWSPDNPGLKYVPRTNRERWTHDLDTELKAATAARKAFLQRADERFLSIIGEMHRKGIGILAGTDTPNPWCIPGYGLHEELEHLVRAGLTPLASLRAATYGPAEFLGKLDTLGTVEQGKIADLVLLDANPLDDIANTRKIQAVVSRGRLFERPALDAMLRRVEAVADAN